MNEKQILELIHIYSKDIPEFVTAISKTPNMQRLKGVGMDCGCEYTSIPMFREIAPHHRFEHSICTGLIIWHFTHSVQQTVSGVLHDISTPVFAHAVDFLNGDSLLQESTEKETSSFIESDTELQHILSGLGLATRQVSNYHIFPIADNDSPKLSADRLEYTLSNMVNYKFATLQEIATIYNDLEVTKNEDGEEELSFRTPSVCQLFADGMLKCSNIYICDNDRYAMQYLALVLDRAIKEGVLSMNDLYSTEDEVIARIGQHNGTAAFWNSFTKIKGVRRIDNPIPNKTCIKIDAKKRFIDPLVKSNRYSQLSAKFKMAINELSARDFNYFLAEEK